MAERCIKNQLLFDALRLLECGKNFRMPQDFTSTKDFRGHYGQPGNGKACLYSCAVPCCFVDIIGIIVMNTVCQTLLTYLPSAASYIP